MSAFPSPGAAVSLAARPERRLIRPTSSKRHVDFVVRVAAVPAGPHERPSLSVALVLDRSGSMQGEKLATAKRAALAVVDRLDERDEAALVVFDNQIDLLLPPARVSPAVKQSIARALAPIEARANTALHEGWLTGCRAIAADTPLGASSGRLARCFLLTDGLANVGLTDPEQIAAEAAGVRERAGVATSTFGIGADYDPGLLAPLATAGGGQFHHLRSAAEIATAFAGELGELFAVAARQVRLEVAAAGDVDAETVSAYWSSTAAPARTDGRGGLGELPVRWSIAVGDLIAGEARHVVARFGFPQLHLDEHRTLRARVTWLTGDGAEQQSAWQELRFTCADHAACDAEVADPEVMHWVGLHHAERARREAAERNRKGDYAGAGRALTQVAGRIAAYAGADAQLQATVTDLEALSATAAAAPMPAMQVNELTYESQRRSRGQRDLRKQP